MSANKHKKESSDAETESSTVPDSTTREKVAFCIGDEVLMKRKDGNFYLGDIVEVDNVREQCLIKFGDNTESWSKLKHLTKLATGDGFDDDLVMCVMCKQSNSTPPSANNEIVVCNRCARGYHQLCHQPVISHDSMRNGSFWQCRRCQVPLIEELRAYRKKAAAVVKSNNSESRQQHTTSPNKKKVISDQQLALQTTLHPKTLTAKIQLPYDLKSLVWDEHHKVNTQQKYCYCGNSGDWYLKMLQCTRCKQWFHERCVSCLQYPLYLGDRFYVFVCSVCNFGVEFARRLEIGWVDMVHLALFNMTVFRAEKYHHIDEHIGYFINCNWAYLQLPPKINKVRPKERKNIISNVLIKNSSRFKSAREVKKSCSLWGLRLRVPPPCPPSAILPPILTPRTPLNEQRLLESDPSCKFLPLSDRPVVNSQKTDVKNQHHYQVQNGGGDGGDEWGDTGEQCTEVVSPILPKSWNKPLLGIKLLHIDAQPLLLPKGMPATGHKVCIKSSVPCFPESRSQIEKRIRAQKAENKKMKDLLARKARKLLKDAIATSQKISQDLPLTPPSSVSAPDTPHLSSSSSNNTTPPPQVTTAGDAASGATATTTPCVSLVSSEEDDDGDDDDDDCDYEDDDDDDTTSHGTLDSIIPPPKDFQGKNNPFVRSVGELLGGGVVAEEEPPLVESPSDPTITLPITLTPVITTLRPTKRRLSEKDIRINRNGEVKRRRLRRQCNVKGGKKDVTNGRYGQDVTYKVVNGKRLRSSTSKSIVTSQPSVTSSPVKNSGGGVAISLNDIKNSVNHYFGAANRIARGEMFTVRAKRVLADGRTEYLIEWHTQPAT